MAPVHEYPGSCACGAVVLRLRSARTPDAFRPRSDAATCAFCRAHDGVWISDPAGVLALSAADRTVVRSFASEQVAFHVCAACGDVGYALFEHAGRTVGVVRVALFAAIRSAAQPVATTSFEGESVADAAQRRLATWTPVERG